MSDLIGNPEDRFSRRSKAILLLWFYLFYVLESNFVLFEPEYTFS